MKRLSKQVQELQETLNVAAAFADPEPPLVRGFKTNFLSSLSRKDEFHKVQMEQFACQTEKIEKKTSLHSGRRRITQKKRRFTQQTCEFLRGPVAGPALGVFVSRSLGSRWSPKISKTGSLHQQRVFHVYSQLDRASKQCQEETVSIGGNYKGAKRN